ncbi:putative transcriptional regulator (plasmid) [Legionella adelaidensis]|uniref:Putative transcriptional regulator n=1 Tax=Legionella adelaidensis TaxID=45056 RepID=A0A0W0R3R0_9GAMM|nr:helix-turn-helix transcriptional regulator [Legionella adelaidensis]KTC65683.1 putative transcriptional regulator [Legionella adelaidensis]VEH85965.1 putative transcriptional regulator [Legionella adelaidensis]
MKREYFVNNFSHRLKKLMINKGLSSTKSLAGVKISAIAKVCGCSIQMARRYVLGEALPEIDTIYKIAKWLNVPPGWLLFGEEPESPVNLDYSQLIQIDPEILEYILLKSAPLYSLSGNEKELVNFIMDIISDVTHIKADNESILKIINISINSAIRFNGIKNEKKANA